ncbi:MAG: hypothetical protein ACREHE_04625 [Rhizomicrobium sp.]
MKNITLAVDEADLKGARVYAAENDTTVNALVRDYLARLAGEKQAAADLEAQRTKARLELVELSNRSTGRLGDWKWNRDDIYRERLSRYEHIGVRGDGAGSGKQKARKG